MTYEAAAPVGPASEPAQKKAPRKRGRRLRERQYVLGTNDGERRYLAHPIPQELMHNRHVDAVLVHPSGMHQQVRLATARIQREAPRKA